MIRFALIVLVILPLKSFACYVGFSHVSYNCNVSIGGHEGEAWIHMVSKNSGCSVYSPAYPPNNWMSACQTIGGYNPPDGRGAGMRCIGGARVFCPNGDKPYQEEFRSDDYVCKAGSMINVDKRSVGESISLTGVPFSLAYSSEKVPGRKSYSEIDVVTTSSSYDPNGIISEKTKITINGVVVNETETAPAASLGYKFYYNPTAAGMNSFSPTVVQVVRSTELEMQIGDVVQNATIIQRIDNPTGVTSPQKILPFKTSLSDKI